MRVTANEVRKKLAQHYQAANGIPHPVSIHLPPGSYSTEFRWEDLPATEKPAPPSIAAPPQPRVWWISGRIAACVAIALLLAAGLVAWRVYAVDTIRNDSDFHSIATARGGETPAAGGDLRMIAGSTDSYLDPERAILGP